MSYLDLLERPQSSADAATTLAEGNSLIKTVPKMQKRTGPSLGAAIILTASLNMAADVLIAVPILVNYFSKPTRSINGDSVQPLLIAEILFYSMMLVTLIWRFSVYGLRLDAQNDYRALRFITVSLFCLSVAQCSTYVFFLQSPQWISKFRDNIVIRTLHIILEAAFACSFGIISWKMMSVLIGLCCFAAIIRIVNFILIIISFAIIPWETVMEFWVPAVGIAKSALLMAAAIACFLLLMPIFAAKADQRIK